MIDISVKDLVKSFDADTNILDGITFDVQSGERVGLLGKNGAGKTTLFRILTGEIDYNSGEVRFAPGKKVGLISQIPHYPAGYTVDDVLHTAFAGLEKIKKQMRALEAEMTEHTGAETLRVGVRDDIINFGFYNETTGKYYGLEIDLAAELAQRIGCDGVEYITVMPDTRKDMLLNGEVDVIVATYSIAESREENFDFSAPYYEDETIIMVEKSTLFDSIRDLSEKNIGIVNGTNAGPLLAQKLYDEGIITDVVVENTDTFTQYEGAYVTKVERYEDLDTLLETGEIDAACMDACIAQTYMNDQRTFLDVSIAHQEYGVATVKDSAFSAPVAEAVQAMLDDGTIERLIDKWN